MQIIIPAYMKLITVGNLILKAGVKKYTQSVAGKNGEYIQSRVMQHTSMIIHTQLGCEDFDFHSLRHTHATNLAEAGANPKYVQARLGHKNIQVTMQIYQHCSDTIIQQGDKILNNMYA